MLQFIVILGVPLGTALTGLAFVLGVSAATPPAGAEVGGSENKT